MIRAVGHSCGDSPCQTTSLPQLEAEITLKQKKKNKRALTDTLASLNDRKSS